MDGVPTAEIKDNLALEALVIRPAASGNLGVGGEGGELIEPEIGEGCFGEFIWSREK